MGVLWDAGEPLSRPEILEKLSDNDWNPNSIHMVLNNLIKKEMVFIDGIVPCGQNYGRAYSALRSREEYAAELALSAMPDMPPEECLPGIIGALVKNAPPDAKTLDLLEGLLAQRRKELSGLLPQQG